MRSKRGFTLIELGVVIAIFGLLVSIIWVSLSGARERAKIAKALSFSGSLYHALGADAIGIWTFDDSGSPGLDSSGYNNNGNINGATWNAEGIVNGALSFDGADDYIRVPNSPSLNPDYITMEAWVRLNVVNKEHFLLYKNANANPWESYRLHVGAGNRAQVRIGLAPDGLSAGAASNPQVLTAGTWYHIAAAFDGSKIIVYVNGSAGTPVALSGKLWQTTDWLWIGAINQGWDETDGLIDEARIYSRALSSTEIQKHYAEGLGKHKNFAQK